MLCHEWKSMIYSVAYLSSIFWRYFAFRNSGCSSHLPTVTVSVGNCWEAVSWSHHYFPSGKVEKIFFSLLKNVAAKGSCRKILEQFPREGSQRRFMERCEAKKALWRMNDGGDPEDLTWECPGVKEGAHVILIKSELKTFVVLSLLKQNSCDYCHLLE